MTNVILRAVVILVTTEISVYLKDCTLYRCVSWSMRFWQHQNNLSVSWIRLHWNPYKYIPKKLITVNGACLPFLVESNRTRGNKSKRVYCRPWSHRATLNLLRLSYSIVSSGDCVVYLCFAFRFSRRVLSTGVRVCGLVLVLSVYSPTISSSAIVGCLMCLVSSGIVISCVCGVVVYKPYRFVTCYCRMLVLQSTCV